MKKVKQGDKIRYPLGLSHTPETVKELPKTQKEYKEIKHTFMGSFNSMIEVFNIQDLDKINTDLRFKTKTYAALFVVGEDQTFELKPMAKNVTWTYHALKEGFIFTYTVNLVDKVPLTGKEKDLAEKELEQINKDLIKHKGYIEDYELHDESIDYP